MLLLLLLLGSAQARIACVGDSITATAQASSSKYYYPTQLQGKHHRFISQYHHPSWDNTQKK